MSSPNEIVSWKAGERSCRMFATAGNEGYRYTIGYVGTPHGVVGVYRRQGMTIATFIHGGREHQARWNINFTDARLVTECKRFAAGRATLNKDADHV